MRTAILKYHDRRDDTAYLASIRDAADDTQLFDTLVALLDDPERRVISDTCIFIRDFLVYGSDSDRERFLGSPVIPRLEQLLFSANFGNRWVAAYTLGKIRSRRSIPALYGAFDRYYDRDPLLLPDVVRVLNWLGVRHALDLTDRMLASDYYVTRWAVISVLDPMVDEDLYRRKQRCFTRLSRDPHPLVRAEGQWHAEALALEQRLPRLSEAEERRQWEALERRRPAIEFDWIKIWFGDWLFARDYEDYTLYELDAFIEGQPQD